MYSPSGLVPFPIPIWFTLQEGEFHCYRLGATREFIVERLKPKDFQNEHIDQLRINYVEDQAIFETLLKEWCQKNFDYVFWYNTVARNPNTSFEEERRKGKKKGGREKAMVMI